MSILGAIGGVIGGVGNYFATKSANKAAAKEAKKARAHDINILQNQVGWRVADSIRAGLHPLAALGMSPASGSAGTAQVFGPSTDFAALGQDLGRAIESTADPKDQIAARATQLLMEKTELENEYTKTQVASQRMRNIQQAAPGIPGGNPDPATMGADPSGTVTWKKHNPGYAQTQENDYGEIAGEIGGMWSAAYDAYKKLGLENMLGSNEQMYNNLSSARRWLIDSAVSKDIKKGGYRSNHMQRR